jgi:hypothetical protein
MSVSLVRPTLRASINFLGRVNGGRNSLPVVSCHLRNGAVGGLAKKGNPEHRLLLLD